MAKWQKPDDSKAVAATREQELKPGKSDLKAPRDSDWHFTGKQQGRGFSGCAVQVNRYSDNPAAQPTRQVPEHKYRTQPFGGDSGMQRLAMQNQLAAKRK